MTVRVLCAGDIHIGRQTSKTHQQYRTADAWTAIVDLALREQVDLVVISGDMIDKVGKSYESRGPLAAGLQRLKDAAIDVVAVTGNHDHDVLASIAGQPGFEHLRLLGIGEKWEQFTLRRDGVDVLHVLGWSFAHEHVDVSPLPTVPHIERDDLPVLGLLHAEVDVASSRYAPASLSHFRGHDVDFWLLGHIHKPWHYVGNNVLYPGSPYAMDPGEPGVHGAWMLTLDYGKAPDVTLIPLSPVEYRTVVIDVSGLTDEVHFGNIVHDALTRDAEATTAQHDERLRELSIRIHVVGESTDHANVDRWLSRFQQDTDFSASRLPMVIDKVSNSVRPPMQLRELAAGNGPAAELASLILALEQETLPDPYADFVGELVGDLNQVSDHSNFSQLRDPDSPLDLAPAAVRTMVRDRSWALLSALIGTRDDAR
ncbi:MAG: DNA repair exonuclease [Thermomicrobiales bacterium]